MASRTFCAWSPLSRCLSPAPARCQRLWSCGSSLVAPSRCGCCASFPLRVAKKWQNQQVFLLKIGGIWGFRWLVRASRVWGGWLSKEVLPDLVPSRLIGRVLFPFLVAPLPISEATSSGVIHSPSPIHSGCVATRVPGRHRLIVLAQVHESVLRSLLR